MDLELYDLMSTDLDDVVEFYINYYNKNDGDDWTYETAYKRIHQIYSREDSLCLKAVSNGEIAGIILGFFEEFYDLSQYNLAEIVVGKSFQNKGVGSFLMKKLEERVLAAGGSSIFLMSVNDEMHERFYSKNEYKKVDNIVAKVKFLKKEEK